MKFRTRPQTIHGATGVTGTLRVDRRTPALLRRLQPGDIAVLDHADLDRATAQELLDRGVAAVVNLSPFVSGRFPNLGPELLAGAGVPLVDRARRVDGAGDALRDGVCARLDGGTVYVGERAVLAGSLLDEIDVHGLMDDARAGLASQLETFTHNTTELLRREQGLLLHGLGMPELETRLEGRPVVVVVREFDHAEDLRLLRRFIREQKPVLVAVDGACQALLDAGHRPDVVVVGDRVQEAPAGDEAPRGTGVADRVVLAARDVVVHSEHSGPSAGRERLDRLGVRPHQVAAIASTADVALLLAHASGASLIVTVGMHATLDEFLDRQRAGLASTFLTRLRVGPRLVDAKSVPQLYSGPLRVWQLLLVLIAGLVAVAAATAATPVGAEALAEVWGRLQGWADDLLDTTGGLLP